MKRSIRGDRLMSRLTHKISDTPLANPSTPLNSVVRETLEWF